MTPKVKFQDIQEIKFLRHKSSDRIQFWCDELKMSIFITENGIEAAGPDSGCSFVLMFDAHRFDSISKTKINP